VAQHTTATKAATKKSTRSMKKATSASAAATCEDAITIDRRHGKERRNEEEAAGETAAPQLERRKKVNRRRQIDPTTCERDYSEQEVEFMNALDDYKRKSGRMFPTCSEVLEVIQSLGYVKSSPAGGQIAPSQSAVSAKPMPGVLPVWVGNESVTDVVN
jgi:hypothetical protein